jgi:hypothetical protein
MKPIVINSFLLGGALAIALLPGGPGVSAPRTPVYEPDGRLVPPPDYREWVFLSSGIDMSYSKSPATTDAHSFDNVFAPPGAYRVFMRTGVWPDKTVLILEHRGAASKGSINRHGQFQTGEVMGLSAHVKDQIRFKGGWGFFDFEGGRSARQIPYEADCYACHQTHAAADTTFVQFYPTLLPVAEKLGTLSPSYVAEKAAGIEPSPPTTPHPKQ